MKRRDFVKSVLASGGVFACKDPPVYGLLKPVGSPAVSEVRRVLVMFKCHFDVGFTDTQENVTRKYFDEYYPEAIRMAARMREAGHDRYVWTTGSWLLYEYLEQATSEQRKRMEEAVIAGDIAWHALPFNWQTEMLDRSMIRGALALSGSLDRRFGRVTCGAKMTDVPCHTRGLVGPLSEGGVKFLDIGVNAASTAPDIPEVFIWKNPDGASLMVMCHHKDYGGVVRIPGSDLAVAIEVRGDNSGNFSADEVKQIYSDLRQQFPNAQVTASNLTEIALATDEFRDNLPVVTQEIGDTWIYGVPSDPVKVARYRELARLRQEWIREKRFGVGDSTDLKFLSRLLLAPEHTWGTDTKLYLDEDHFKPEDLDKVVNQPGHQKSGFQTMARSWAEKRDDLSEAIERLPPSLGKSAIQRLRELLPLEPSHAQLQPHDPIAQIETAHFVLALDPKTGAIRRLFSRKRRREWATAQNLMALFTYQTLSQSDYDAFFKAYVIDVAPWAYEAFGKPGCDRFGPRSREWHPTLERCWSGRDQQGHRLLALLKIDDAESERSGLVAWPQTMYLELYMPDAEPVVRVNFSWFQKQASRLPEAMWLSFRPNTPEERGWMLEKVNQAVSPFDVVRGGNRHMHAISDGLHYGDPRGALSIGTMDAPVVALGVRAPMNFSNAQPQLNKGIHFSLYNNAWGTNYIQWFGENMRFRFTVQG